MDFGFGTNNLGDGIFGRADVNKEALYDRTIPNEEQTQDNGDLEGVMSTFSKVLDYFYNKIRRLPEQFHPLFADSTLEKRFTAEVDSVDKISPDQDIFDVYLKESYQGNNIVKNIEEMFPASEQTFDRNDLQPTPGTQSDGWWAEFNRNDYTITEVDSFERRVRIQSRESIEAGDTITFYPPAMLSRIGQNTGIVVDLNDPPDYTRRALWNKNLIRDLKVSFRLFEFLGDLYGFDVDVDALYCINKDIYESIKETTGPDEEHAFQLPIPRTYNGKGHVSNNSNTRWIDEDDKDFSNWNWVEATLTVNNQEYEVKKLGNSYIDVKSPIQASGTGIDYTLETEGYFFTDIPPWGQRYDEIIADVISQDSNDEDYCYPILIENVQEVDKDTKQPKNNTGFYEIKLHAEDSISGEGERDSNDLNVWIDNDVNFLDLIWGETLTLTINNNNYNVVEINENSLVLGSNISNSDAGPGQDYTFKAEYNIIDDIDELGYWMIEDSEGKDLWIEEIDKPDKAYVIYNLEGDPTESSGSTDGEICHEKQFICKDDWQLVSAYIFRVEPNQVVEEPNADLTGLVERINQKLEDYLPFHVRLIKRFFLQGGSVQADSIFKVGSIIESDIIKDKVTYTEVFGQKFFDVVAADVSPMDEGVFQMSSSYTLTHTGTGERDSNNTDTWLDDNGTDFSDLEFDSATLEVDSSSTYQVNSLGNGFIEVDSTISETGSNLDYILTIFQN